MVIIMFPVINNNGQHQFSTTADTKEIILGIYALLMGSILFTSLFSALRKLSYSFQMGDINLLFPSPLTPNHILMWSLMKKLPADMAKTFLPALLLAPTMVNLGLNIEGIFLVYLSILSLGLLLTPVSFLVFLLSVRYHQKALVRGGLLCSVIWILFSWLQYAHWNIFSLSVLRGYQAPEILNFPLLGWILQLARAAFFGPVPAAYTAIILVALTALAANLLVFGLAKDYYEDVLEPTERLDTLRASISSGKMQDVFTSTPSGSTKTGWWTRWLTRKDVTLERRFRGSWTFMFIQVVKYRRTDINEYVGYLAPLCVIMGLVTGYIALRSGHAGDSWLLYGQNGLIAYLMFFRSSSGPLGEELALPYIYTLPGSFFQKTLAINALPTLRYGLNLILLNLSYAMTLFSQTRDAGIFMPAVILSLLVTSLYWEQSNIMALAQVLVPSSIDRKLFYPLLLFVEILLIGIPALVIGGLTAWVTESGWFGAIGMLAANTAVGLVLLLFSDLVFSYLEMREFSE